MSWLPLAFATGPNARDVDADLPLILAIGNVIHRHCTITLQAGAIEGTIIP